MKPATDSRNRQLAKIHIARKQLNLTEDCYRGILVEVCGVESSADLDAEGRSKVLDHFRALGFQAGSDPSTSYPGRPSNMNDADRGRLLAKIEAILAAAGKSWRYADGICRRACGIDKVSWAKPPELHTVVGILLRNAKKYGWTGVRT